MSMLDDALGGLGCQPFAPTFLLDHEGELDLVLVFDAPWQEATPSQELARGAFNRGPQAKFWMVGVAVKKPVKFFLRLLKGSNTVRVVHPNFGITIEIVQRVQIAWRKAAKQEAFCIQDDHEPRLRVCVA